MKNRSNNIRLNLMIKAKVVSKPQAKDKMKK